MHRLKPGQDLRRLPGNANSFNNNHKDWLMIGAMTIL